VLSGTLTRPRGTGARVPVVVTITGSGPQDRDGRLAGINGYRPFRALADTLGRRGVAVLRFDERGVGGSTGTYAGATTQDFAADVRAALAWLRTRPDVDPRRLALLGHSEGGIVAPMVAATDSVAAVVLTGVALAAGGLPVPAMAALLGVVSVGLGTSFPVVQVVVQAAAGQERLGSATASVQFTRSLGSATGTALMGAVLFGTLVAQGGGPGGGPADLFVALVNQGPAALSGLTEAAQAAFRAQMTGAFRAAFLTAAAMTALAAWLCTRVPLQRI